MVQQNTFSPFIKEYKQRLIEPHQTWPGDIKKATLFVHEHLFESKLTVVFLKEQCRINGKVFPTIFKNYLGYHPLEYIVRHRINFGKILLKETTGTVTQIALELGFSSLSAFTKTFKNRIGMTPSQWRELAKDGNPNQE